MTRSRKSCSGYTLLEVLFATTLLAFVSAKAYVVIQSIVRFSGDEASKLTLEDNAERVLDRIAYSLMGADRQTLLPDAQAPLHSQSVTYRVSFGVENGDVIWGSPERIGADPDSDTSLTWWSDADSPDERRVVWTNMVRPLLEGETINGLDDNGNGLVDERGISFDVRGGTVTVRLTLGRDGGQATSLERTVEGVVTCRNFIE